MAKRQLGIFYIDATKAYFYGSNSAAVLQIEIPEDTMSYSDVVNKDKFYQLIQTLVTTNKIEPVPLLILFSPYATYEKDAVGKTPEEINTDLQQFVDAVPYERVLSRIYKLQDKTKVVAVNKDMYEVIKHAFEKVRFSIVAVVTLPLLQQVLPDIGKNLNLEIVANKFEPIKQYSLITLEEINNPGKASQQQTEQSKINPLRLFGLIGVFVILMGVLIVMFVATMQPAPKPATQQNQTVITAEPTPTLTPFPTIKAVVPSAQVATPSSLKTTVINGIPKQ